MAQTQWPARGPAYEYRPGYRPDAAPASAAVAPAAAAPTGPAVPSASALGRSADAGTARGPVGAAGGGPAAGMQGVAELFGLLADPTRLRIVLLLRGGERNVTDLCAALGAPQPTVSHHLCVLRLGSVVTGRRQGKLVYYQLHGRVSADEHEVSVVTPLGYRVRVGTSALVPPALVPPARPASRPVPLMAYSDGACDDPAGLGERCPRTTTAVAGGELDDAGVAAGGGAMLLQSRRGSVAPLAAHGAVRAPHPRPQRDPEAPS